MKHLTKIGLVLALVFGLTSTLFAGNVRVDKDFIKVVEDAYKHNALQKLSKKIEGKSAYGLKFNTYTVNALESFVDNNPHEEDSGLISIAKQAEVDFAGYQCVGLVKAVARKNMGSVSTWKKGANISRRKPIKGHVIATFNGDNYYGHVAIVLKVFDDHIIVIDQNWDDITPNDYTSVGQIYIHSIDFSGNGVSNASNYYIVRYP